MDVSKIEKAGKALEYLIKDKKYAKKAKTFDFGYKKPVWLISERGNDALDNGYHLYRYLVQHPECGVTPIYVIDASSDKDLKKITDLKGETVLKGTAKHYMLMHKAEALISTHAYGFTPDKDIFYRLAQKDLFKFDGANVFLSHGVTDKDIEWLYEENYKPDVFCVSCKPEYNLVRDTFKQPREVVVKTGMPRYDALFDVSEPKKQILVMPTWRLWLNNFNDDEFKESQYFERWNSFVNYGALVDTMKERGYKIVFYLHPELKKRKHLFKFKGVEVRDDDIQELMKESEILVTDYSSVYSDMAYMNRKIIFYQFDKDRYTSEHYNGLIADYERFGTIIRSNDDIAGIVNKVIVQPNKISKDYIENRYFIHHDDKNCERVVEAIKNTAKRKKGLN